MIANSILQSFRMVLKPGFHVCGSVNIREQSGCSVDAKMFI